MWSKSVDTDYKEEGESLLEAAPLVVGVGLVEAARVKATCPEVFVEVLRESQRFLEVNQSSLDKVLCRCIIVTQRQRRCGVRNRAL